MGLKGREMRELSGQFEFNTFEGILLLMARRISFMPKKQVNEIFYEKSNLN